MVTGAAFIRETSSFPIFLRATKTGEMFRVGLYARVSTNDQQTFSMQNRAMREYAARRGWTIALQFRKVNSGAAKREAREKLLEAARRREIAVVAGLAFGRRASLGNRPVGNPPGTGALGCRTAADGRAMAGLLAIFAASNGTSWGHLKEGNLTYAKGAKIGQAAQPLIIAAGLDRAPRHARNHPVRRGLPLWN
jgi:hypothetical protein